MINFRKMAECVGKKGMLVHKHCSHPPRMSTFGGLGAEEESGNIFRATGCLGRKGQAGWGGGRGQGRLWVSGGSGPRAGLVWAERRGKRQVHVWGAHVKLQIKG